MKRNDNRAIILPPFPPEMEAELEKQRREGKEMFENSIKEYAEKQATKQRIAQFKQKEQMYKEDRLRNITSVIGYAATTWILFMVIGAVFG